MKKKITLSILVTGLLFTNNLFASDKMKSFADNVVLTVSNPTNMSLKDRTVLHGGGVSIKAPITTLTPLNFQAPSMKAGCGGIDLTFGSLSYLSGDQFVAFAENIMAAAPGVAFDLALKAVCPSCADTLKALEEMANQINQMSLDSCAAAKGLVNSAESAIFGSSKDGLNKGNGPDWLQNFNDDYIRGASSFLSDFNSDLNSLGYNRKFLKFFTQSNKKSYVIYTYDDKNFFNNTLMMDSLRSMMGDLLIKNAPSGNTPGSLNFVTAIGSADDRMIIKSKDEIDNTQKIFRRLIGDSSQIPKLIKADGTYYEANDTNFPKGSLLKFYKDKVENILTKFSTRASLDDDDIKFLSYFNDPIYKIFNIGATSISGLNLLRSTSEELAMMLSAQIMYELIIKAHMIIVKDLGEIKAISDSQLEKLPFDSKGEIKVQLNVMAISTRVAASEAYKIYEMSHQKFTQKLSEKSDLIRSMQKMKSFTLARTNPDLFFSYTVSNALSGSR